MLTRKLTKLKDILKGMGSVLVAYSGGVDSTLLLKIAGMVLKKNVLAVTAKSKTYPDSEFNEARRLARGLKARHLVINTCEFRNSRFTSNPPERCYWCKRELFGKLKGISKKNKLNYVVDGANLDDLGDFRPGTKAAREFQVRHPLEEAGLTKKDIRALSWRLKLPTWDKPALACLASRIPYGERITEEKLRRISGSETFLHSLGFSQVRVRTYGRMARIEVPEEELGLITRGNTREKILKKLKQIGYNYVAMDLEGYRTGSMNEIIGR